MDYTKDDVGDPEKEMEKPYRRITLKYMGAVKAEILKDFIIPGMKAEKLKSMMVIRSRLARLKQWAVSSHSGGAAVGYCNSADNYRPDVGFDGVQASDFILSSTGK
jgi:hypothetical protein